MKNCLQLELTDVIVNDVKQNSDELQRFFALCSIDKLSIRQNSNRIKKRFVTMCFDARKSLEEEKMTTEMRVRKRRRKEEIEDACKRLVSVQ
ncbi:CLUMA_CG007107, isoform A [Clunio marinus]|uniref:CLUMA_CG007107, isoform A n=1 Tax=Clunio marinus TaxID=568069 RepID=A0A1J1I3Y0_9DIPT|nr:CLUMA_CG007107, isoform A [Clunio marinus]